MKRSVAVIGGGWAGMAAAVRAAQRGLQVKVFEMAPQLGGRARTVNVVGQSYDNGQHILIGAYARSLALMRDVGAVPEDVLLRLPLSIRYPDGRGLEIALGGGPWRALMAMASFRGWHWHERLAMVRAAARWALTGYRCNPLWTVNHLCATLPQQVRRTLIEPLCLAALNTLASQASAQVFLRVLQDALAGKLGSSDLLIPRLGLDSLLASPAATWLKENGVRVATHHRVECIGPHGNGWAVDNENFDGVILASSAKESARLTKALSPSWSEAASNLSFEPIVTVYLLAPDLCLPCPMMALQSGETAPAQFVFDLGQISARPGLLACVISGAKPWVDKGAKATGLATLQQMTEVMRQIGQMSAMTVAAVVAEKRATFTCLPGLRRPPAFIHPGLVAAGDYVAGPYPATLEGAVRSGENALELLQNAAGSVSNFSSARTTGWA